MWGAAEISKVSMLSSYPCPYCLELSSLVNLLLSTLQSNWQKQKEINLTKTILVCLFAATAITNFDLVEIKHYSLIILYKYPLLITIHPLSPLLHAFPFLSCLHSPKSHSVSQSCSKSLQYCNPCCQTALRGSWRLCSVEGCRQCKHQHFPGAPNSLFRQIDNRVTSCKAN